MVDKNALTDWDETAINNDNIGGITLEENTMRPPQVNNAMREHMAQVAKWLGDDTLASAATTDLGSVPGRYVSVTGTTTITAFGTIKAGTIKYVKFTGALTLTHNATSLILMGGANRTTAAGDMGIYVSEGSGNWREVAYFPAAVSINTQNGQYKFPATANPSTNANTLDDYEEGTFTPTLTCGTSGTITLNAGSILGYVKIGSLVTVSGLLTVDSVSSPSGTITLGTLPFASVNANRGYTTTPIWVSGFVGTAGIVWQAFISTNATTASIGFYSQSTGTQGSNPAALIQAGTLIIFSATYQTV